MLTRRIQTELVALGRADDASARLQTLADAQRDDDPSGAAITLVRMADLALADGRPDAARVHADAAVALAATGTFARERRDALRMRVRALHASGDLETAFTALDALHAEERDAARRLQLGALAKLQARLEDGRSAAELARLRETQRIDVINARHARTLRAVGATALGVLVLLALALAFYQRRVSRRLRRLSATDSLTGLLNRRAAIAAMQTLPAPSSPTLRHVVFLVDVDHFKRSNDRHGHGAGDAVLVKIAQRFTAVCRPGDLVARWGGEEFLVVCRALDRSQAAAVAERLRVAIAERPVHAGGVAMALTVSIGFALPAAAHVGGRMARRHRRGRSGALHRQTRWTRCLDRRLVRGRDGSATGVARPAGRRGRRPDRGLRQPRADRLERHADIGHVDR